MVKRIPVFEFAFAAYATMARRESERGSRDAPGQPFETAWRSTGQSDGALMVKIGVLDDGGGEATALAACQTRLPVKEIWLGQVREVEGGYCGVVCMIQEPLRTINPGQRIDFGPAHILDWTISYGASPECAALQRPQSVRAACDPCANCIPAGEALG